MGKPKSFGFRELEHECNENEVELYYDRFKKRWVKRCEYSDYWYPATVACRSLKAAKRHLRKHAEIPKETKFRLVSRYIGCDLYLIKK